MDATLQALGGLLLRAVPTLILLIFLHQYLKWMFFRPLEETLRKRREVTEGAREAAEASFARASEKVAAYEAALRQARGEIYKEQDEMRRAVVDEQTRNLEQARERAHALVREAKRQIEAETAAAKRELAAGSGTLADQIATALLERRAG
jgi:F-type H+-transporting ATPase subunit b